MEPVRIKKAILKQGNKILVLVCVVGIFSFSEGGIAIGAGDKQGVTSGETSQRIGQQGMGVDDKASSPILGGPEIIIGAIRKIQGEEYTIEGDHGQNVRIRVTTDTNKVCPSSGQAEVSSGQEGVRERAEVPPTPHMQQQSRGQKNPQRAEQSDQQDLQRHATAPPSRDPSQSKSTVGSTDPRANEDVARGSGFRVGRCAFKEGDQVRVEASDMGTATTIKQLLSSRSRQ